MRSVSAIVAVLAISLGCKGRQSTSPPVKAPAGNVVFRDASGNVVATADVQLPANLPTADGTFKGNWRLLSAKPAFPSGSTKSGRYDGRTSGGLVSIDINPGVSDSNVVLRWSAGTEPITGTWYHSTFSGAKAMGTFSRTARTDDVRSP